MANSYIIQSTSVVCTNMQVPNPLKIGVSRSNPNIVHTNKTEYFLTIDDRKISESFKCKMAAKKWGGLALLCVGLAIGGAILLTVATGGLAGPVLIALAVGAQAGIAVAAVGAAVAIGIGFYKEAHDCDVTLEIPWVGFHNTVKFQKKNALLNSSVMNCPQGGIVTLIVDPVIAQQAADFISNNNQKEIIAQGLSKFGVGLIGGLTGGTNVLGVSLAIGFDYMFENGESERLDLPKETKEATIEAGTGVGTELAKEGSEIASVTKTNQALTREITRFNTEAFEAGLAGNISRQASRELAADIASRSFENYDALKALKGIGIGIGGAIAGFILEQAVNVYEDNLYVDSELMRINSNNKDANNNIGVIATDK
ncbi:DUF4280 domain-containing protein [Frigoriflavimonas asaccharolytica]|uniref:DUF4280 domain-containing protein n=1 Tax=Frigoriflavimonas asaccharolytica TaxID=2735899 RepID=A0A8J8GAN7_9FLAO|nr:DUF4280 domain-containing protein [Frigoriflavimonas asaccharolytica]NRS94118.1 hypothetical protein [Frigoriflavimonas asaccharolytica]